MTAAAGLFLRYGLYALLGWSAAVLLVVEAGLGERYSLHPDDPASIAELPELDLVTTENALKPLESYSQVGARPLFNPDRRPFPVAAAGTSDGNTAAPPPPVALEIVLTSVAMHGDVKVAVFTDKKTNKSQAVRLGAALEGDLAGWTLKELKPRQAVFEGPGGSLAVDLRVFDGQGGEAPTAVAETPPVIQPQPEQPQPTQAAAGTTDEAMTPEARAELIRQRIEERRRQMREEAARASQEKSQ